MKNVEIPDSSPAYLGRIPAEHDRQRQLQYIDRTLGIHHRQRNRIKSDITDFGGSHQSNRSGFES